MKFGLEYVAVNLHKSLVVTLAITMIESDVRFTNVQAVANAVGFTKSDSTIVAGGLVIVIALTTFSFAIPSSTQH